MKEFEAHILIVDDDKGIRELVKEYLDQNNFITSTADLSLIHISEPTRPY